MAWQLSCLICGVKPEDLPEDPGKTQLIRMQEHVMAEHGYQQWQIKQQTRVSTHPRIERWIMPDGTPWLQAMRSKDEDQGVDPPA
jgi:starvation-inducible outer membrane lipoprotein